MHNDSLQYVSVSQCSTLVRKNVVRATIQVNGKLQILGTRSPQTPESIDLKFDWRSNTTRQKLYKLAQQGRRGKG